MTSEVFEDWSRWVFTNDIAKTAAAFTIGVATSDFIRVAVGSAFDMELRPMSLLRGLSIWLATVAATYLIMEFGFSRGLSGISTALVTDEDRFRFARARMSGG